MDSTSLTGKHPSASALLDWFDRNRRDLPWRDLAGVRRDPYRVWLAEIMLQQTTVATAIPRFRDFLARWPDVGSLARADIEEVLDRWAGLGYYARARNLHAAARKICEAGGRMPDTPESLRLLPGIGPYTANAVAAIAYDRPVVAVDGNVERVISRVFRIDAAGPALKSAVTARAMPLVPSPRAGDFSEALMDLGALICTPRNPDCSACPWRATCAAHAVGEQALFPYKPQRSERPVRRCMMFLLCRDQHVLVRRRAQSGLLGGMLELPSSPWIDARQHDRSEAFSYAPFACDWQMIAGQARHSFTHFHLDIEVMQASILHENFPRNDGEWLALTEAARLPSVMRKALSHAGMLAFRR